MLLLDINLGDGSGFELCKELRETTDIPILFISARTSDDDKIIALSIGGDDYIQKPCSLSVLLAKVKAVLKRYGSRETVKYDSGRLVVDFNARQVLVDGTPVKLTSLEFKLLAYLVQNEGRMIPKQELFEKVWEDKYTGDGTLMCISANYAKQLNGNRGNLSILLQSGVMATSSWEGINENSCFFLWNADCFYH